MHIWCPYLVCIDTNIIQGQKVVLAIWRPVDLHLRLSEQIHRSRWPTARTAVLWNRERKQLPWCARNKTHLLSTPVVNTHQWHRLILLISWPLTPLLPQTIHHLSIIVLRYCTPCFFFYQGFYPACLWPIEETIREWVFFPRRPLMRATKGFQFSMELNGMEPGCF